MAQSAPSTLPAYGRDAPAYDTQTVTSNGIGARSSTSCRCAVATS